MFHVHQASDSIEGIEVSSPVPIGVLHIQGILFCFVSYEVLFLLIIILLFSNYFDKYGLFYRFSILENHIV